VEVSISISILVTSFIRGKPLILKHGGLEKAMHMSGTYTA
jgi:hypothetical protein